MHRNWFSPDTMVQSIDIIWDLAPYPCDSVQGDSVIWQAETPVFFPKPMKSPQEATEWFVQTKPLARFENLERTRVNSVDGWIVIGTLMFLLLIVLSKQFNPRRFFLLLTAGFSSNGLHQLLREWNPTRHFFALVFTLVYIFSVSLFSASLIPFFLGGSSESYADTSSAAIPMLMILVGSVVLFRIIMAWLLGFLFDSSEPATFYRANMLSHLLVFSIVAMVLAIVVTYMPLNLFWYLSLFISALLLIISLLRSLMIGLSMHRYSGLLIFLYLCALEIVPVLVLIKSIGLISARSFTG